MDDHEDGSTKKQDEPKHDDRVSGVAPSGDDDDNDDDDDTENEDGIVVSIDADEVKALNRLLHTDHSRDMARVNLSNHIEMLCESDIMLRKEITTLVHRSIFPSTRHAVVIRLDDQLILVPHDVSISDRLASLVWPDAKLYEPSRLPHDYEFNKLLPKIQDSKRVYAVFAARYSRMPLDRTPEATTAISHLYLYHDFAAIMVRDGCVIDYAIHGVRSNINDMFERHDPETIYYNAREGDALHTFVRYKWQPFYASLRDRAKHMQIYRRRDIFNPLPFCTRHDVFCALCNALRDLKNLSHVRSEASSFRGATNAMRPFRRRRVERYVKRCDRRGGRQRHSRYQY